MSAASDSFDMQKYGRLLSRARPRPIDSEEEYQRQLEIVDALMSRPEELLSPEENTLLETLTTFIEKYEEEHYPIPEASPVEVLKFLLEDREMKPADLANLLGGRSRVSDILNGKRNISKAQAKSLADFFKVSVELFI